MANTANGGNGNGELLAVGYQSLDKVGRVPPVFPLRNALFWGVRHPGHPVPRFPIPFSFSIFICVSVLTPFPIFTNGKDG